MNYPSYNEGSQVEGDVSMKGMMDTLPMKERSILDRINSDYEAAIGRLHDRISALEARLDPFLSNEDQVGSPGSPESAAPSRWEGLLERHGRDIQAGVNRLEELIERLRV